MKRILVTIPPEWEPDLLKLKKDKFFDSTKSEMLRYVLQKGIIAIQEEKKKCSK